jgi:hypothetical protein
MRTNNHDFSDANFPPNTLYDIFPLHFYMFSISPLHGTYVLLVCRIVRRFRRHYWGTDPPCCHASPLAKTAPLEVAFRLTCPLASFMRSLMYKCPENGYLVNRQTEPGTWRAAYRPRSPMSFLTTPQPPHSRSLCPGLLPNPLSLRRLPDQPRES